MWKQPVLVGLVVLAAGLLTWWGPGLTSILFFVAFILLLIYEISLIAGEKLPRHKKWAICFLLFAAILSIWTGLLGLSRNNEILTNLFFPYSPVFPIVSLSDAIARCVAGPCKLSELGYQASESNPDFSVFTVVMSSVAAVASIAMLKRLSIGYLIWATIIVAMIVASVWDIWGSWLTARALGYPFDSARSEFIFAVGWSGSCATAFWLACVPDKHRPEN